MSFVNRRRQFFKQATGNDKPKNTNLPIRRRKENDLPRSHNTESFQNLPLTNSTFSNDSQPTKVTSDETVVKHQPTTVEPLQIKDNLQHHQIPSPITSSSSTISTTSPRSIATPQSTCTTTVTDVTELKHAPIVRPRRMRKDYVSLKFKDIPQSTSNPVIHPVIPVSTTVSSDSSQNITSRLTSDENIVEDKTNTTQNKSTTKTIQEDVPNLRNESENHAPIIKPRRMKKDYDLLQFKDNPQSTSNPVIRPVIPVSTTVSSNSSQNITSRLTSDENIVEGFISEDSTKVHKKHDENHDINKEYEDHNANEKYEHKENEQYALNKKQEVYVEHEQDVIQYVRKRISIRSEFENFTKTIEDLQKNLRRKEQEIEEQKKIFHETSVEMVKLKTLYDDLKCENTLLIQQQKGKDLERKNMLALIASLQQNLYEAKTRLLVPSSKLELVKEKLHLHPTEFGCELQLIKESKEAIENMQKYAEGMLSLEKKWS